MASVFDDQIFDHIGAIARVDADSTHIHSHGLARAEFIELENIAALDQHDLSHRSMHGGRHFGVQFELAVLPVNGNEVTRLDEVDDELQFFLAGVP